MRFRARTQPVFGRWASLFVRRMCTNICVEWLGSMAETTKSKVVVAMAKLARSQRDCIRPHAANGPASSEAGQLRARLAKVEEDPRSCFVWGSFVCTCFVWVSFVRPSAKKGPPSFALSVYLPK